MRIVSASRIGIRQSSVKGVAYVQDPRSYRSLSDISARTRGEGSRACRSERPPNAETRGRLVDPDQTNKNFDEFIIALATDEALKFRRLGKTEKAVGRGHPYDNVLRMPENMSTLEALRNYENDLKSKGFQTLFVGNKEQLYNGGASSRGTVQIRGLRLITR